MDNIGAEVGQKMRSAIKAKLMELGCYVDDELPDYIMVMVANKRTTSQMNQDLQLFLTNKTSSFVDWLQIVLKKLKEITVTNPDAYKRGSKHKGNNTSTKSSIKVKKEKKAKQKPAKLGKAEAASSEDLKPVVKSLTDDLPINANKLTEMRKIVIMQDNQNSNHSNDVIEDNFDIPPLSEVTESNENDLAEIEAKINNVKSRLGIKVSSDTDDDDDDFINLKIEPEDLFPPEKSNCPDSSNQRKTLETPNRKIQVLRSKTPEPELSDDLMQLQKSEHPRIVFGGNNENTKKHSVLSRLGKRPNSPSCDNNLLSSGSKKTKINLVQTRKEEEEILGTSSTNLRNSHLVGVNKSQKNITANEQKITKKNDDEHKVEPVRESALKRLGVMSKVAIPRKEPVEEEAKVIPKEVSSVIKVKPRIIPPQCKQANKNLLLKAVAEAQRSIAQTPVVGIKLEGLFTKRYREKLAGGNTSLRKLPNTEKNKIKNILASSDVKRKRELSFSSDDENLEYVPKPVKRGRLSSDNLEYIPSLKDQIEDDDDSISNFINPNSNKSPLKTSNKPTFIITLDGITKKQDVIKSSPVTSSLNSQAQAKTQEVKKRKSPIIFDVGPSSVPNKPASNAGTKVIPDKLPTVLVSSFLKTKERCKYWPSCRQGDKCDFVHPTTQCKAFPQCKFGEKCLYIHPICKFENSCTRKDCPYTHSTKIFNNLPSTQKCKFYPNCTNPHCTFYHPRQCKYGKFCKNQADCSFSHDFKGKGNLTWRSAAQ